MGKLDGKVAIVTGASRGIGKAVAIGFAKEGAKVAVVARTEDPSQSRLPGTIFKTAEEIKAIGGKALAIRANIVVEEEVQAMIKKVLDEWGRIDILVNNAGVAAPGPFAETTSKRFNLVIGVNLMGSFLCIKGVLPTMIKQKAGNIINMSSGAGKRTKEISFASPTRSLVYSVTKFGVEGFTLALAGQVNKFNINVNALRPGPTDTRAHAGAPPEKKASLRKPDDIKKIAVFLASQGPMGITGESIDAATWETIYLNRNI